MSRNKLFYHNSACVTIATSDLYILCDPWLTKYSYYGTWIKKPSSLDPFDTLVDIDYIFLSHIHPDHYCPESIHKIFSLYGSKPILVADWGTNTNILYNKLLADGFGDHVQTFNQLTIGSTELISNPNYTDAAIDIDSYLIVHDKKHHYSVINYNDCAPSDSTIAFTQNYINSNSSTVLLCLGYSGAGPFPQNFYSPSLDVNVLFEKAEAKKQLFFDRYRYIISCFEDSYRIPFAGKYDLAGPLSVLNEFRGVPDPLEVLEFDDRAYVLADGVDSYFDLLSCMPSKVRHDAYQPSEQSQASHSYLWEELFNFVPSNDLLERLLLRALPRAHKFSQCTVDRLWHINVYETSPPDYSLMIHDPQSYSQLILSFNTNSTKNPLDICPNPVSESYLYIDKKALLAVLLRLTHWNNYEIGSVYQIRRYPDNYCETHDAYLYFLQI